jgi:hypothetical protein
VTGCELPTQVFCHVATSVWPATCLKAGSRLALCGADEVGVYVAQAMRTQDWADTGWCKWCAALAGWKQQLVQCRKQIPGSKYVQHASCLQKVCWPSSMADAGCLCDYGACCAENSRLRLVDLIYYSNWLLPVPSATLLESWLAMSCDGWIITYLYTLCLPGNPLGGTRNNRIWLILPTLYASLKD